MRPGRHSRFRARGDSRSRCRGGSAHLDARRRPAGGSRRAHRGCARPPPARPRCAAARSRRCGTPAPRTSARSPRPAPRRTARAATGCGRPPRPGSLGTASGGIGEGDRHADARRRRSAAPPARGSSPRWTGCARCPLVTRRMQLSITRKPSAGPESAGVRTVPFERVADAAGSVPSSSAETPIAAAAQRGADRPDQQPGADDRKQQRDQRRAVSLVQRRAHGEHRARQADQVPEHRERPGATHISERGRVGDPPAAQSSRQSHGASGCRASGERLLRARAGRASTAMMPPKPTPPNASAKMVEKPGLGPVAPGSGAERR